jgi:tetratricopeptide (TPR) repeat protein
MQLMARLIRQLGIDQADVQAAQAEYLQAQALVKENALSGRFKLAFRDATIAVGDAHLYARELDQALKNYRTAEALAEPIVPPQVRSAKIGSYPEHLQQLVQHSKLDEATQIVQKWYELFPSDIPRGEALFWMGKLDSLLGNYLASITPLRLAVELGQGAAFEAEARWLLAEAYREIGDKENHQASLLALLRSGLAGTWRAKAVDTLEKLEQK